jgi:hypothetical protein
MLLMIVVGVAIVIVAIVLVWFLVVRGSKFATVKRADFDDTYDGLVAERKVDDRDRDAAWRDFDAWQHKNEEERLSWEEPADE